MTSAISRNSSLEEFVEHFLFILSVLRLGRDFKAVLTTQKFPVSFPSTDSDVLICYMKYLTPYAYQFVAKQIQLKDKVIVPELTEKSCKLSSSDSVVDVTAVLCTSFSCV